MIFSACNLSNKAFVSVGFNNSDGKYRTNCVASHKYSVKSLPLGVERPHSDIFSNAFAGLFVFLMTNQFFKILQPSAESNVLVRLREDANLFMVNDNDNLDSKNKQS